MAPSRWRILSRRGGFVTAAVAALAVATAGSASAHHCYKVDWNDRAHENLAGGNTAWLPLSDLADMVIAQDIGLPQCVGYGDQVAQAWMDATGTAKEPLIHSRATIAGGAAAQGKAPKGIAYLGEADFVLLEAALGDAVGDCLGG